MQTLLLSFLSLGMGHQRSLKISSWQLAEWFNIPHNGSLFQIQNHKIIQTSTGNVQRFTQCSLGGHHHAIEKCHVFLRYDKQKRKDLLKEKGICFKCLSDDSHILKNM